MIIGLHVFDSPGSQLTALQRRLRMIGKTTRWLAPLLVAVTACGDAAGPEALRGSYSLVSIDGAGAPFTIVDHTWSDGSRTVTEIVYDSLTLRPGSVIQRSQWLETTVYAADGSTTGPLPAGDSYSATYVREGDLLLVQVSLSPNPGAAPTDTFRIQGERLLQTRLIGLSCDECPSPGLATFEYRKH